MRITSPKCSSALNTHSNDLIRYIEHVTSRKGITSSMHNMFGASVSEVYNIIWCQFDLKSEVIANGDLVAALSKEVCSSC